MGHEAWGGIHSVCLRECTCMYMCVSGSASVHVALPTKMYMYVCTCVCLEVQVCMWHGVANIFPHVRTSACVTQACMLHGVAIRVFSWACVHVQELGRQLGELGRQLELQQEESKHVAERMQAQVGIKLSKLAI